MKFITISDTKGNECFLNLEAVVAIEFRGEDVHIVLVTGRFAGTTGIFRKPEAERVMAALQELQDEAVPRPATSEPLRCGYCEQPMVGGPRCSHCGGQ